MSDKVASIITSLDINCACPRFSRQIVTQQPNDLLFILAFV